MWTIEATTNSIWTTNNAGAITNNSVWTLVGFLNAAGYQGTNHLTDSNAWAYDHRIYRASCGNLRATNVVGFIKREAATNNLVIANQFVNRSTGYSNNTVTNLFPTVPAGVNVDAHLGTNWDTDYYYGDGEWDNPGMTLNPGEGFVFINRSGYVFDILLYGDLISGSAENFIQPGMHLVSSAMPVSGLLCADLGFPIRNGETIFLWNGAAYDQYLYQSGSWSPYEPCIHVGEGFWVNKVIGAWWWQNYSAW